MSYKDKYEHALDRFTELCRDMFQDLERLKRENQRLREALEDVITCGGIASEIAKAALKVE